MSGVAGPPSLPQFRESSMPGWRRYHDHSAGGGSGTLKREGLFVVAQRRIPGAHSRLLSVGFKQKLLSSTYSPSLVAHDGAAAGHPEIPWWDCPRKLR